MTLLVILSGLPSTIRRYEPTFARARATEAAFASYPTTAALLAALSLDSPLPLGDRQELVRALITQHRILRHCIWSMLLLHAFRPMLLSLRARDRGSKEDRDSRIVLAFFQALARTPLAGQPVFIALRRATARALFQAVRAERVQVETALHEPAAHPSVEPHVESTPFVACSAYEIAMHLLSRREMPC